MRNFKYLLFVFICLFISPLWVNASNMEYTLFDATINVNENRTLDIKENYKVYFVENSNSISRVLNKNIMVTRPDKSEVLINNKISKIKASTKINEESSRKSKIVSLKVNGKKDKIDDYELSYRYNFGKDNTKGYDELYYDIVSNIDDPISNLTFTITFPKNINKKNISFAIDDKYGLSKDDITFKVEDNVITGTLNKLLTKNQKLSIYVKLPDGYFVGASDNFNYLNFLILIFPFIGMIILFIFFIRYGLNNHLKIKRKEDIPYNFDSAEIGYLFKGKVEEMDLTSLVIYLANKGYLNIIEYDDGYKLGKDNSFKFIKLKDYDQNNAAQEIIFNEMFRESDEVNLKDIEYHFFDTYKEARSMLDNEDNHKKLFFKNLKIKKIISLIFIALSILIVNFNPIYLFTNAYIWILPIGALIILGFYLLFISNSSFFIKLLGFVIIGASAYIGITSTLIQWQLLAIYAIGTSLIILMCLLYNTITDRTKYGNKVLSEVIGFKYYLDTMTKKELEEKMEQDSSFFFNMIPYAYVLNSLDIWIKKGKDLIVNPPLWYIPSTSFTLNNFEQFIKNVLYTTTLVMLKQVYSESQLVQYSNDKVKTNLND